MNLDTWRHLAVDVVTGLPGIGHAAPLSLPPIPHAVLLHLSRRFPWPSSRLAANPPPCIPLMTCAPLSSLARTRGCGCLDGVGRFFCSSSCPGLPGLLCREAPAVGVLMAGPVSAQLVCLVRGVLTSASHPQESTQHGTSDKCDCDGASRSKTVYKSHLPFLRTCLLVQNSILGNLFFLCNEEHAMAWEKWSAFILFHKQY